MNGLYQILLAIFIISLFILLVILLFIKDRRLIKYGTIINLKLYKS